MPEITLGDPFGRAIADTVRACRVRSVIEIGSWDGTGSTTVLMHALENEPDHSLTCVEVNPERHAALVALTASRLVLVHTDEHPGDDLLPKPYTSTTSEATPRSRAISAQNGSTCCARPVRLSA